MRNFPPIKYFHSSITIINPNNNELQTGKDLTVTNAGSLQDYSEIQRNAIRCNIDKKIYAKRERATISISLPERNVFSPDGYCLTVVKTGTLDTNMYGIRFPADKNIDYPEFVNYFPETKELSLSGRIVTDKGKTPVTYARIHLALLGNNHAYFGTLVDKAGRFRFSLPYHTGVQDVFITVETGDDLPVDILINNNFSTDFVQLSQLPSFLSPKQSELIREIMFNMQVEKIFKQPLANTEPVEKEDSSSINFFGSPLITIKTNDYVKLPTLEEFFFELIPDFRNCLFWIPNIEMDIGKEASFDFYTSDNHSEYVVVVHGITAEGVILEGQCNFVVK
ncbi:hypothetical protein ES705_28173 [subsurface metagenome]